MDTPNRKTSIRKIASYSVLALLAVIVGAVTLLWQMERKASVCRGIRVNVQDSVSIGFVSEGDVLEFLGERYGSLRDVPVDSIDLAAIEHHLSSGRGILRSEVYLTPDGLLHADIRQRSPIARIQTPKGAFYCDAEGYLLPVSPRYITRVQIVDGDIALPVDKDFAGFLPEGPEHDYLMQVVGLIRHINRSPLWRENIGEIHVEKGGELTLLLRERPERFLFGQPKGYAAKLARMEKYFNRVLPLRSEEDTPYKSVNVQYKGQIICRNK